jgi:UDP-glucose 6-dehydrogenase
MSILEAVEEVNERQKTIPCAKLQAAMPELQGKTIAVWGLAFKPGTDDMREAPSLTLIESLLAAGCQVKAFDPVATNEAKRRLGQNTKIFNLLQALEAQTGDVQTAQAEGAQQQTRHQIGGYCGQV